MKTNLSEVKTSGDFLCPKSIPLCQRSDPRQPNEQSAGLKESGVLFLKWIFISIMILLLSGSVWAESFITETSWYDYASCRKEGTNGRICADGKYHDLDKELVAASWDYPFNSVLRISTLDGHKSVVVRVADRGPSKKLYRRGRRLDLSKRAFSLLFPLRQGIGKVRVERGD